MYEQNYLVMVSGTKVWYYSAGGLTGDRDKADRLSLDAACEVKGELNQRSNGNYTASVVQLTDILIIGY